MAHDHHNHHAPHETTDISNLKTAFFLNFTFTIIEIIGGIFTNSVAILSDAIHDLGDSLSLGLAWYLQKLSKKGRNKTFTYGYKRFSLLGAIITSVVLVVGSVIMLYEAIPRLFQPEQAHIPGMIGIAILGVLANGAAVLRTRSGKSMNEKVVSWHLLEDVLGWVAVLLGAILMYFFDLPIIDPILSIGITLFILYNIVRQLIGVGRIILQAAPEKLDTDRIQEELEAVANIQDVHHTHLWSLDGEYNILTVHVKTDGETPVKSLLPIKKQIRQTLHRMDVEHVTIEFEAVEEDCVHEDCL